MFDSIIIAITRLELGAGRVGRAQPRSRTDERRARYNKVRGRCIRAVPLWPIRAFLVLAQAHWLSLRSHKTYLVGVAVECVDALLSRRVPNLHLLVARPAFETAQTMY